MDHSGGALPLGRFQNILTSNEVSRSRRARRQFGLADAADGVEGFVRDRVVLDWKGLGGGPEVSRDRELAEGIAGDNVIAAARHVPLERLALNPQCGFESVAAGIFYRWTKSAARSSLSPICA